MRSKEESHDYRYFPDPDLPPLVLRADWVAAERERLPELPEAKRSRLTAQYALPAYDARVLAADVALADYFEEAVAQGADAKAAANWIMSEVLSAYNATGLLAVPPGDVAALLAMVRDGVVSHQAAKKVYGEQAAAGGRPRDIAERLGLIQVRDTSSLERWVDEVIAACPAEVTRYRQGEAKLLGFLVGQVMKRSQGQADPKGVQPVLVRKLAQ
jgi:aspartyl-tRNA(Asn)/glutamyl-tRNA(Gln) amidotransferase subunit B